jgi:hypothetical protein
MFEGLLLVGRRHHKLVAVPHAIAEEFVVEQKRRSG